MDEKATCPAQSVMRTVPRKQDGKAPRHRKEKDTNGHDPLHCIGCRNIHPRRIPRLAHNHCLSVARSLLAADEAGVNCVKLLA